jgi:hypothetical protein
MRYYLSLLIVACAVTPLSAATDAPSDSGIESLGNELLEDLAPNSPSQPAPTTNRAQNQQPQPQVPGPQPPRFNDLGEDIGQPSGTLSLARVRQAMQHAESLLGDKNAAANLPTLEQAGKAQKQVVAQLDKLIAELSKQCQNGQCQPSDQPPKPSQRSQNKPGKPKSAAAAGKTAARDSTDRLNQANANSVDNGDKADVEALMKDLWGHLPERTREQMMQSFSEEFLPQYELEIEQYYRRLSEDDAHLRAD